MEGPVPWDPPPPGALLSIEPPPVLHATAAVHNNGDLARVPTPG